MIRYFDSERDLICRFVAGALRFGWSVSVFDGGREKWSVRASRLYREIIQAIERGSPTFSMLELSDVRGEVLGVVMLIHGNGDDVIAAWTNDAEIGQLVAMVRAKLQ